MPLPKAPPPVEEQGDDLVKVERLTRGGLTKYYEMRVLQQPERAPAADRRPVDPPPVVQLRVLEGYSRDEAKDITFNYQANFFLFAELCQSRPMAHGRVQTPAATQSPVLTGMPVSGMAYLDRPTEAGYFLFPDLSVRHEGRYVLSFHLYEEIKKEEDRDPEGDPAEEAENPCFQYRMAVKSHPFVVYSAKKFPGLTESTSLSKTISEQGCRVRIRRDVRMRRRDAKPGGNDYDNGNTGAENEYRNARRTQTPEIRSSAEQLRDRSSSNSSEHRAAYPPAPERRPSVAASFQAPPPPLSYGAPAPSNVHLRFGSDASSAPYHPHPYAQPAAQPSPISPTTSSYYSTQPSPYQPGPSSYGYSSRPSSQYAPSNPPPTPRDPYDRRPSSMAVPPSPSIYVPRDMDMTRREHDYRPEPMLAQQLPPVNNAPQRRVSTMLPSLSQITAGPSHITSRHDVIEASPPGPAPVPETARAGSKRGYSETFTENTRPLYDGRRQQDAHHSTSYHGRNLVDDQLEYKRADGRPEIKPPNSYYAVVNK
ncbi:hypothetical protein CCHL11_04721 [Colletotrichum chlorophyti]|uniref:Velvet domain-containing protein n=1 Tax=Colletotrichum chlorophyti TaxID=708187 RepID=A0A1Q8S1X6_9PEZI|nr:hypothetical protein CCHL11_04721 [Colletotrichum chlorophyti]